MNINSIYTRLENFTSKIRINKTVIYFLLALSSFLECFFYSLATSPRVPYFYDLDAPIFMLIGKGWKELPRSGVKNKLNL